MSKRIRPMGFGQQMKQSMRDLQSIMLGGESPDGNGQFTLQTIEVVSPRVYNAKAVRRARALLNVSPGVFAELMGVSLALVRAWELGTRVPAPIACRLLDQISTNPSMFARLTRPALHHSSLEKPAVRVRRRRVA
jgi:DNA-binding transcriptional regulator YiaG